MRSDPSSASPAAPRPRSSRELVLVRREHERAVARQVDLHEAEARRVAGAVAEGNALAELEG